MTYKAYALVAPRTIAAINVATPDLGSGEILVRVRAANLCPTDIKKWKDDGLADLLRAAPLILGHEFAGDVVAVGPDCGSLVPGSRIAVDPVIRLDAPDGSEFLKGIGAAAGSAPDNIALLRDNGIGGGFAELVKIPARNAIPIPDDLSYQAASLIEPLADIVHGIAKAGEIKGSRCAVFGLGPMGLMHVELLSWLGADVVGIDPRPDRRAEALAFGANLAGAPGETPKVDVAFIAAGGPALVSACHEAIENLDRNGRLVIFASGTKSASLPLDLNRIHYANQQIIGVVGFRREDAASAISYLQKGAVDVERIRSPRITLAGLQEAFGRMGEPGTLKYGIDFAD